MENTKIITNTTLLPVYEGCTNHIYVPSINFFADKILNKEYFTYCKLSIEWWMLLSDAIKSPTIRKYRHLSPSHGINKGLIPLIAKEMCNVWDIKQKINRQYKSDQKVIEDILRMSVSKKPKNFFLSITDRCNIDHTYFPQPQRGPKYIVNLMYSMLPKDEIPLHALPMRIWAITGEILEFIKKIQHKPIVIVGPEHLYNFGYKLNIPNFKFIKIHSSDAILHVHEIKQEIEETHKLLLQTNEDVTYFLIGGGAAMWLATKLHGLPNANIIDIGRSFDVFYFYDEERKKYPNWMFGQWLNKRNTKWILNKMSQDKHNTYRVNDA